MVWNYNMTLFGRFSAFALFLSKNSGCLGLTVDVCERNLHPHPHPHRRHEWNGKRGIRQISWGFLKRRVASTSISPSLNIFSVQLATIESNTLSISVAIKNSEKNEIDETPALIDSGAGGIFTDQNYARRMGFQIQKLDKPISARNVDNTENKQGKITSFVELNLTIGGKMRRTRLMITGLGKQKIVLGFPWLNEHNPDIDWKTGRFAWRPIKQRLWFKKKDLGKPLPLLRAKALARQAMDRIEEETDPQKNLNRTWNPSLDNDIILAYIEDHNKQDTIWINTKTSSSIEFHLRHDEKKEDTPLDQQIPSEYHKFLDVFYEEKADRFPEPRSWDHKIELKEGFQPKSFKTYNLTPEEQAELDKFLKDNLEKGYIRPSQSPMGSPFFFVKKNSDPVKTTDTWTTGPSKMHTRYPSSPN